MNAKLYRMRSDSTSECFRVDGGQERAEFSGDDALRRAHAYAVYNYLVVSMPDDLFAEVQKFAEPATKAGATVRDLPKGV